MNAWRGARPPEVSGLVDEPLFQLTPKALAYAQAEERRMADRPVLEIQARRRAFWSRLLVAAPLMVGLAILGVAGLFAVIAR